MAFVRVLERNFRVHNSKGRPSLDFCRGEPGCWGGLG